MRAAAATARCLRSASARSAAAARRRAPCGSRSPSAAPRCAPAAGSTDSRRRSASRPPTAPASTQSARRIRPLTWSASGFTKPSNELRSGCSRVSCAAMVLRLGLRLRRGHAGLQAADHRHRVAPAVGLGAQRKRKVEIEVAARREHRREIERGRQHADHRVRLVVERERQSRRCADPRRSGGSRGRGSASPPAGRSTSLSSARERPAELRLHAEDLEEVVGDRHAAQPLGLAAPAQQRCRRHRRTRSSRRPPTSTASARASPACARPASSGPRGRWYRGWQSTPAARARRTAAAAAAAR